MKLSRKQIQKNQEENKLLLKGYALGYAAGLQENLKRYTPNEVRELIDLHPIDRENLTK